MKKNTSLWVINELENRNSEIGWFRKSSICQTFCQKQHDGREARAMSKIILHTSEHMYHTLQFQRLRNTVPGLDWFSRAFQQGLERGLHLRAYSTLKDCTNSISKHNRNQRLPYTHTYTNKTFLVDTNSFLFFQHSHRIIIIRRI